MILASDTHCPLVEMINSSLSQPFLIAVVKQRLFDAPFKIVELLS